MFLSFLPSVTAQETVIYPSEAVNLTGNWDLVNIGDLNNSAVGNILNETNGNPAYELIINFTEVPSAATSWTLTWTHQYNGSVGHANNVDFDYWNPTSETWVTWATATNAILETLTATIASGLIRDSNSTISLRTIHATGGTTTHTQEDFLISISALVPTADVIHIHWEADPPSACSICEVSVSFGNASVIQDINYTIDDGSVEELCIQCANSHLELEGLSLGPHNITFITTSLGNQTADFIIVNSTWWNYSEWIPAIWAHNETERTTNNWFDRVLGGDIMTNEILFFLTVGGGLIWLGFKTGGKPSIPIFGFSGVMFVVLGLFIRDTTPFDLFAREVSFTNIGLMNLTAMWFCFIMTVVLLIYPTYFYSFKNRNT
jgi:hypothetical protein